METITRLLNVKEVAVILNVSPKTLYDWATQGKIPCIKLQGALRFEKTEIEAWILSCKRPPSEAYNIDAKLEARKGGKR